MKLLLTKTFQEREWEPLKSYFKLTELKKAVAKVATSAIEMPNLGYKNCKLLKLKLTGKAAARMIVFVQVGKDLLIPLVLRLKKDKIMGENLSLNNRAAEDLIEKRIEQALEDLKNQDYLKLDL
jgi:hypothetical protein